MLSTTIIALLGIGVTCCEPRSDDSDKKSPAKSPVVEKVDAKAAKAAFERFKKLTGSWKGKSTKGWTDTNSYRVIAAGSVVMGTSFDAHPNETAHELFAGAIWQAFYSESAP